MVWNCCWSVSPDIGMTSSPGGASPRGCPQICDLNSHKCFKSESERSALLNSDVYILGGQLGDSFRNQPTREQFMCSSIKCSFRILNKSDILSKSENVLHAGKSEIIFICLFRFPAERGTSSNRRQKLHG